MSIKKITAFITAAVLMSGPSAITSFFSNSENNTAVSVHAADYTKDTKGFVSRMYNVVLNRNPDSAGLNNWVQKLNSHTASASDIIYGFFNSQEYTGKKKSNEDQVTDCYNAMLGRNPDSKGRQNWSDKLDIGMTINAVCQGFVGSQEFKNLCSSYGIEPGSINLKYSRDKNYLRTYFVYRLYDNCLMRQPDSTGLENWCKKLENGTTGSQIASGFLLSNEFKNAHYSNEEYVYILYATMLGRSPDEAGLNNWVNKLDTTDTREKTANGFLFSSEFSKQCSEAGINLGSKITEKDSSTEWKYNIEVLRLCNIERAKYNIAPLKARQDLWEDIALVRSKELTTYYSHNRPDGSMWYTAYEENNIPFHAIAENIAAGYATPETVVNAWMNSEGHRTNILNSSYESMATGYCYMSGTQYKHFFSQNFLS